MGSLEEEMLWQMVHDFIEAEPATPSHYHHHYSVPNQSNSRCFTLQEILEEKTVTEAQILQRIGIHIRKKMEMEKTTKLKKWLAMCLKRDGFDASFCYTSWHSTPDCPSGYYEYIDILERGGKRLIVDIDFKSQFEVARPTKSYLELSSHLPSIFVGGEEKVRKVVRVVCMAAEESMKERGLHIPPWRRSAYMNSKWLSDCTREDSSGTENDEVANKRDPPAQMKPMRRDMGGTHKGYDLSTHFASMGEEDNKRIIAAAVHSMDRSSLLLMTKAKS
ncbi:hypothetical protein V2J09_021893 [Rumex salicifolius]